MHVRKAQEGCRKLEQGTDGKHDSTCLKLLKNTRPKIKNGKNVKTG
jgi:hypothetical protein